VPIEIAPAHVDEDEVKHAMRAQGATPAHAAEALAELKAQRQSARHAGALVIGTDQILSCDGRWYDKAADRAAARAQLQSLRGKRHVLSTAAVVAKDGAAIWRNLSEASLEMRDFSDAFLDGYLAQVGDDVLKGVGAYQIEGRGVQLFNRIAGDNFVIQGLPLLPLLAFLREHKVLPQ
jgi:septum formation protein